MKALIALFLITFSLLAPAEVVRSRAQVNHFKKANACPGTGISSIKSCNGYVVDHIKPLSCGGADNPSNMQWQTIAEGKAKDKWERKLCNRVI